MNSKKTIVNNGPLFYYNGTCFPMTCLPEDAVMNNAKKLLEINLREGISLDKQAEAFTKQLDLIENLFYTHCNPSSPKRLKKVVALLNGQGWNTTVDRLYGIWCINICSLLIMKKIKNDDNNGILKVDTLGDTIIVQV
jgi:hypothetical protein